jgi:redox-sensitive bicupin YhaK (pirin superfamily)
MKTHLKSVLSVLNAPEPNLAGDGFFVSNFFPCGNKIEMSPFHTLNFNAKMELAASLEPKSVGAYPHRGFEMVTLAYHGAVAHQDSAGNKGIIYPGDVQWMTAARGILYKESLEQEFSLTGGIFQMVKLWVNLPAKDKMGSPRYQPIKHDEVNKYDLAADAGTIEVIAGEYEGVTGNAATFTKMFVFNARLNAGGAAVFNFPSAFNTGFLVIEGNIIVNDSTTVQEGGFVYFANDGTEIQVKASEKSVVLILSGEPIEEPVAHYGPFLMNTSEEIEQAIDDYNRGCFGYLED